MKKKDTYLIVAVLAASFLILAAQRIFFVNSGSTVEISQNGKIVGNYPLWQELILEIQEKAFGKNVLTIENGKAFISEADCPDGLCVKQGRIDAAGESIICLPHRLSVVIKGDEEPEFDTMVR